MPFRRMLVACFAFVPAVAAATLITPAAQAAAPTGLAPVGSVSSMTPTLSWTRTANTGSYDVQVDDASDFSSPASVTTVNNRWVPTQTLPTGQLFWRVRSNTTGGTSAWSNSSFTINPSSAPTPVSPVGDQHLSQPTQPALLTWTTIPGAVRYDVQVDSDGDFLNNAYDTSVTPPRFQVPAPQTSQKWFWRVRVEYGNDHYSTWSGAASYVVDPLPAVTYGAARPNTTQSEVELKWDPVPGATMYQVQVGEEPQMRNIIDDQTVRGTRYSPDIRFRNNQFYWRVRPVDTAGNRPDWPATQPQLYDLKYLESPTLLYPANRLSPAAGGDFYYQWTPVPRAGRYRLEVTTDPTFTTISAACDSVGTTFVPDGSACMPNGQGTRYYWRVYALDTPGNTPSLVSPTWSFTYQADMVQLSTPAPGATVTAPVLTWQPQNRAERYLVSIWNSSGSLVIGAASTTATSFVPTDHLDDGTYSWTVQAVTREGSVTPFIVGGERSFTLANPTTAGPSPLLARSGRASDAPTTRQPLLTWDPVAPYPDPNDATKTIPVYYTIDAKDSGSSYLLNPGVSMLLSTHWSYPAAVATDTYFLVPGSWDWRVVARRADTGAAIGSSAWETFTVAPLSATTGQRIALDGQALDAGAGCSKSLGVPESATDICLDTPATPILDWDPVTDASSYRVYLYNDRELTTPVNGQVFLTTSQTRMSLPSALQDNTADHSYYWYVLPCKANVCNDDPTKKLNAATNAFRKLSPAVVQQGPGRPYDPADLSAPPTVTEADLKFQWQDYLLTNLASPAYYGGAAHSGQSGQNYRIQVSTSPTAWDSPILDSTVDESWLTPWRRSLPEGTFYWRVAAYDGSGNQLVWSAPWVFTKASGQVQLQQPGAGDVADNGFYFRWTPSTFLGGTDTHTPLGSYRIQVFKNDDATHSDANRVINEATSLSTFAYGQFLPPSSTPYLWRVQWRNGDNQEGQWSVDGHFRLNPGSVALLGPVVSLQPANGLYFTWQAVPYAATYRLEAKVTGGPVSVSETTAATAFAPTGAFSDGAWQWRVVAMDGSRNDIAASAWRGFTVDATPPPVTGHSPMKPMRVGDNIKVYFSERVSGVSTTSVKLFRVGATKALKVQVTLDSTRRVATINPAVLLKHRLSYEVRLSNAIVDVAHNRLVPTRFQVTTK